MKTAASAAWQRSDLGDVHDLEGAGDDAVVRVHSDESYIARVSIGRMEEDLRVASVPALDAIPGLVHGFERRRGEAVDETRDEGRARVARALAASGRLHLLRQVHGAAVRTAPWEGTPEADAAVASVAGVLLGIETADCLPVLLVDPVRRAVGAAHAGWRGTVARVAPAAVAALVAAGLAARRPDRGARPVDRRLLLRGRPRRRRGVRPGRRAASSARVRADARTSTCAPPTARSSSRPACADDAIHDVLDCTFCTPGYFSYRRDGKGAGRMINFVGWRV